MALAIHAPSTPHAGTQQSPTVGRSTDGDTANDAAKGMRQLYNSIVKSIRKSQHANAFLDTHSIRNIMGEAGVRPLNLGQEMPVHTVYCLDEDQLKKLLEVQHPLLSLGDLGEDHALVQAVHNIYTQYDSLHDSLYMRCHVQGNKKSSLRQVYGQFARPLSCFDQVDSPDIGLFLKALHRGHAKSPAGQRCGWQGYLTLESPRSDTLAALIMSNPCQPCVSDRISNITDEGFYLGELAALSLLLAEQLPLRRTTPPEAQATNHPPKASAIAIAIVINMIPTEVRVVQATVPDPTSPTIAISVLDSFEHDINRAEHSVQNKDEWLECKGCRKVLSWLLFLPHTDHSANPNAIRSEVGLPFKNRVVSGNSNSSTETKTESVFTNASGDGDASSPSLSLSSSPSQIYSYGQK